MNRVTLVGNLTRDPELSQTQSGISVCKFTIAVNRNFTNANCERDADFINIVTWRTIAENCGKYLVKGKKVALSGQIQTRSYDDRNGEKRYVTEVVADDVEFIGGNSGEASEPKQTAKAQRKQTSFNDLKPIEDDGLPF